MIAAPVWSSDELEAARLQATEVFREERMREPLDAYLEIFDAFEGVVEDLLESTVDLTDLDSRALELLASKDFLWAFRCLAGPPISEDDLKTLADATLAPTKLRADPDRVRRIVDVVRLGLDRRRFPWVAENREPTEGERRAAVVASTVLIASSRAQADRRNEGKEAQEEAARLALSELGLREVPTRAIPTLAQAPEPGEFCGESLLGNRKADIVVRLWDTRGMPIECKVSNSSVNSVKRLNNDAAAKAEAWVQDFGRRQVVPAAILSGVYKLHNLMDAQSRGLTLFWAHDLQPLTQWIADTREG